MYTMHMPYYLLNENPLIIFQNNIIRSGSSIRLHMSLVLNLFINLLHINEDNCITKIMHYWTNQYNILQFLSMKLATVNPELNFDLERILSKDVSVSDNNHNLTL